MDKLNKYNYNSDDCVNWMFIGSLSMFLVLFLSQFLFKEMLWASLGFILWLILDFREYKKVYKCEKSQEGKK